MDDIQYQRDTLSLLSTTLPLLIQMELQAAPRMKNVVREQIERIGQWLETHAGLPAADFVSLCIIRRDYLSGKVGRAETDRRMKRFKSANTVHVLTLAFAPRQAAHDPAIN